MRFQFTLLTCLALFTTHAIAQQSPVASRPVPQWLQAKIASFEKASPSRPARSIYLTRFSGKPAYYVSPTCCDIPSELYDESGHLLCYPDGGFAGGDGKCPAFVATPSVLSLVWSDSRQNAAPGDNAKQSKQ